VSGVRTVKPQERAVILRFGRPIGTGADQLLGPGAHWAWPYPIDEVVTIPVSEIQKVTSSVGWYSISAADEAAGRKPYPSQSLNPATEGYLVMGDNNIMHARVTLGFRITDPITYSLDFTAASNSVQNALNNALVYAASQSTADEALTNNTVFKERVLTRLRQQIDSDKLGITIEPGSEVKVVPPAYLQPDFEAVLAAATDISTRENTERGNASKLVLDAQGEANSRVANANAERERVINSVQADAKSFTVQLPQYVANPELFRQRKLTEQWQDILSRADDKFFNIEPLSPGQTELRLLLSREPAKPRTAQPAGPTP
jgi:membrane protease subunit HflK